MKLRLRENSVRLRLQMSEIEQLGNTGSVTETISFGNRQSLVYTVRVDDKAASIFAAFYNNEVLIRLPAVMAEKWIGTEKVGLEKDQAMNGDTTLNILIEKDFKCLTERSEDESDMFPNPNEVH